MEKKPIISFCGDVCTECPRYIATLNNDAEALLSFAGLWYRLGFRPKVVEPEEIKCHGCNRNMVCSNGINDCEHLKHISNCGECDLFPCDKINAVFMKTDDTMEKCRQKCTENEFLMLERAFLRKRQILTEINEKHRSKKE